MNRNKTRTLKIDIPFWGAALALALPIAMQSLLTSCATLIDTAMITGLGDASVSAMGVAARYSFFLNVACYGFASGCASLLAQYWGAKETANLRRTLGFTLTLAMAFGIVMTLALAFFPEALMMVFTDVPEVIALGAEYLRSFSFAVPFLVFAQIVCAALRSVENVRVPLLSAVAAVGVNVFLNWVLIFGKLGAPALGLRGAAIASAIGIAVQALVVLAAFLFGKNPYRGPIREMLAFDRRFCARHLRVSLPVLLNESLWALGTNIYVMVFARQGVENHAGYTLYENIQQLFFVFFVGICGACSIMVGMRVGQGDHEDAYRAARRFSIATPVLAAVMGGLMIALRDPVLSLFPVESEATRAVASACLLLYGVWLAFRMIPYTLICGVFRAGGDTKTGFLFDALTLYGIGIPAVLVMGFLVRPDFVWIVAAMFLGEDLLKTVLCVRHFRSRKWIKQLTATK